MYVEESEQSYISTHLSQDVYSVSSSLILISPYVLPRRPLVQTRISNLRNSFNTITRTQSSSQLSVTRYALIKGLLRASLTRANSVGSYLELQCG